MRIFSLVAIIIIILSSCVSKKKYQASLAVGTQLSSEVTLLQKKNEGLEKAIQTNVTDFEIMKKEMHLSNAIKSDEMSSLLLKVSQLTESNTALENKLSQTATMYYSQKQTSQSASDELKNLRTDNLKLKSDTESIKYALELAKERYEKLEIELNSEKNKYSILLSEKRTQTGVLQSNEQKIASIEQQLVKNKQKIDAISVSLIELRKEMLSAQSEGKSIDPNKNKHIDKMAKELGHY